MERLVLWGEEIPIVFFFQAEDGIRDRTVTGVQTCALPILREHARQDRKAVANFGILRAEWREREESQQIGRASCRERGWIAVGAGDDKYIKSMRRNVGLLYIVMDNETYGWRTGPISSRGHV